MIIPGRKSATPRRRSPRRLYVDVSLCLFILVGCPNADFGRVRSSLVTDDIHNWVGRDAARDVGAPISLFPLTDDERLLRDLAYPLIEPPYDRQRWYSVLGEWGVTRVFNPAWWRCDPTAYAARLMTAGSIRDHLLRSPDRRRPQRRRAPRLFLHRRAARYRHRPQARAEPGLRSGARDEVANALARVGENVLIVGWVQHSLAERVAVIPLRARTPDHRGAVAAGGRSRALDHLLQQRSAASALVPIPDLGIGCAVPIPLPPRRAVVSK